MNIRCKLLPILALLMLASGYCIAHDLHGTIVDEQGSPVPGAYVIHKETENHAHSNELGIFSLNDVEQGDTLVIMHIGFETREYIVDELSHDVVIELVEQSIELSEVVVGQSMRSLNLVSQIDIKTNPVNSAQDVLRTVPGLFIAQHAGGGKAEQIFLRGFDIDHGTDVAISVDGMPGNMVSHAHGQGYADMHFVIPETIEAVDFGKGPYYANVGNFNTAGYVNFETRERLKRSSVTVEGGMFGTFRTAGLFNLVNNEKSSAYLASEFMLTDGPFESPQNFNRINVMGKYTVDLPAQHKLSLTASHFTSKWDASGQIPQRAVDDGSITRFGAIDDTEGGQTSRTNLLATVKKGYSANTFAKHRFFYSNYNFELYSNFTFFLEDPVNGDQIRQREKRDIFGAESEINHSFFIGNTAALIQGGIGFRHDNVDENELSNTANRRNTLSRRALGDVDETNIYGFANLELEFGDLTIAPAIRVDYFKFNYVDALDSLYSTQAEGKAIASPKLNFIYSASPSFQVYLKGGIGFHSNDTRVVVAQEGQEILPAAYGADLGGIWKPFPRMVVNGALWYLFLEQEFVYVGDAAIVEPSGKTRRIGADLGIRYQISDWLFFDTDLTYSYARSIDEPEGAQYIPLAPEFTWSGGLTVQKNKFAGAIRWRHLTDRPANEDNTIIADGFFVADLNASYTLGKVTLGVVMENIFNTEWNEAQFATESRLKDEPVPVEEIHFTPGTPFFMKGVVTYTF